MSAGAGQGPDHGQAQKAALRARAIAARKAVPDRAKREAAIGATLDSLIWQAFAGARIAAYVPMRGEVDPMPGLADPRGPLLLPVVEAAGQPLLFRLWQPGDALEAGAYGTTHPPASAPALRPRLILVPLAGFDRSGHRLGYGGGFYDRTLARLRESGPVSAVGLAFDVQEVESIPALVTDQPLDAVITESGLIRFG